MTYVFVSMVLPAHSDHERMSPRTGSEEPRDILGKTSEKLSHRDKEWIIQSDELEEVLEEPPSACHALKAKLSPVTHGRVAPDDRSTGERLTQDTDHTRQSSLEVDSLEDLEIA